MMIVKVKSGYFEEGKIIPEENFRDNLFPHDSKSEREMVY
jgi:hypothetical protein